MRILARRNAQTEWDSIRDRDLITVTEGAAAGWANWQLLQVTANVRSCDRRSGLFFCLHGPLLDGIINDFKVVYARHHPGFLTSLYVAGDRDGRQDADER